MTSKTLLTAISPYYMNNNCANQRLYWSLTTSLKYMD
ncbi:hypothetical protein RHORCCE3_2420 [Rickettsia hoogstraalii str. RCCE3]|nr:hypothetical protein RHORCCE3_2420 [Rickettsia hoogstraalii str. RCCE3]